MQLDNLAGKCAVGKYGGKIDYERRDKDRATTCTEENRKLVESLMKFNRKILECHMCDNLAGNRL